MWLRYSMLVANGEAAREVSEPSEDTFVASERVDYRERKLRAALSWLTTLRSSGRPWKICKLR